MDRTKLTHEAYTVGWICVLESELNASRALLDKEHDRLPPAEKDDNMYILGEMGKHNVVIAFPAIHGIGAAARTETNMIRTFCNLRFGLMVGVGGGAPNPDHFQMPLRDIRLGDVIVSEPKGDQGGVIQYDMGQWRDDEKFHKRSHLNKPPTMLLKAMKLLKSDHGFGKGEMNNYITDVAILSETQEVFEKYQFPGQEKDLLYREDYTHVGGEDCSACDSHMAEMRAVRKSKNPVVHYGIIASGNAVIKDPQHRDRLRKEWGVSCFEMEAAGLMDNFPCLVVRGISDYADSHKNDIWQPYAAVVAAAYAKDLLRVILPYEVDALEVVKTKEVVNVLSDIRTNVSSINSSITAARDAEVLDWLSPKDYGSDQSDILSQRQEGTGTWLVDGDEFHEWMNQSNRTMYCKGMPGAGKTVMTAVVVDHLQARFENDPDVGVAYIYCDYRNETEQTLPLLFRSLLRQLVRQLAYVPELIRDMYDRHKRAGDRPRFSEIVEALQLTISIFKRTFILVDALDEMQVSHGPPKQLAKELSTLQKKTSMNFFATSRSIPEIEDEFNKSTVVDIRATETDVERFLDAHIEQLPSFVSRTRGLKDEIMREIIQAIDGMFLLAKLHLNSLTDKISIRDIEDTLKTLPRGSDAYDQTYWETMNNIQRQKTGLQKLAMRTLSWICCSRWTLSIRELQHALAVEESHRDFEEMNITEVGLILSVCKGLVIVDRERGTIRLVHYTTKQYFERTWEQWFPEAHRSIAETLIRYLSFDAFNTGACQTSDEFGERLFQYPLYFYAAQNWGYHVRDTSIEENSILMKFLEDENCLASSVQAIFALLACSDYNPKGLTGLHVAAFFGLERTVRLLGLRSKPNIKDSYGMTPIFWASMNGYEAVVNALLENDAVDPDCEDNVGKTPLLYASGNGYVKIVDCLLQHGADLHHMDQEGLTPLSEAFQNAHNAIIEEFLHHHVNVNYPIMDGDTPLRVSWRRRALIVNPFTGRNSLISSIIIAQYLDIMALRKDNNATVDLAYLNTTYKNGRADTPLAQTARKHIAVLDLFMEHGIDSMDPIVNNQDRSWLLSAVIVQRMVIRQLLSQPKVSHNLPNTFQTALSLAALKGHEPAVHLFLTDNRVHPDHRDMRGQTPIFLAACCGNDGVVKILLETNRVDPNGRNSFSQTPLLVAAQNGYERVVRQLLESSAVDPELRNLQTGRTPLALAAWHGHKSVVQLLLTARHVTPDSRDNKGMTPLSFAALEGNIDVVDLLLQDNRVDPNNKDKLGRTPLSWACGGGQGLVAEHLLGVETLDAELPDDEGRTPLFWAAWNGHHTVVSYLLSMRKVNLECRDNNGQTPLSRAVESRSLAVVELLLSHDTNVNAEDKDSMTPLMKAVENGHAEMVEMLLAAGASTGVTDKEDRTPLLIAVKTGQPKVVQALLNDAGLDPDDSGSYGVTPLELAKECGREDIVKLIEAACQRGPISACQNLPPRPSFRASPSTSVLGLFNSHPGWKQDEVLKAVGYSRFGVRERNG